MNTRSLSPERLIAARERAGLTPQRVAATVGVSLRTVRYAEAGTYTPRADALVRMADLYGVPVDDLFTHGTEGGTPSTARGKTTAGGSNANQIAARQHGGV